MSDEHNEHEHELNTDELSADDRAVDEDMAVDRLGEKAELEALAESQTAPSMDSPRVDVADESSDSGFALLILALLVLVGGSVYFVGQLLSSNSETAAAQASAEAALAEFDADPGVVVTLPPESLPLVEEPAADEVDEVDSEPEPVVSTTTTTEVAFPTVDPSEIAFAFVNRVPGDQYGMVGYIDPAGERHITELECDRLDLNDFGGICLSATAGLAGTGRGLLLGPDLNPATRFGVSQPSRAAVSPDGAVVAWTGFTLGHSYLAAGEFATTTQLISVERGIAANLEEIFTTYDLDDEVVNDVDRNFWGVTFVDSDRFYATLGARESTFIVEGRVSNSRLDIVHENASCPEVSPDATMIVAKEQRGDSFQLVLINNETGERSDLVETRSVDDQVEWVDNSTILYGVVNPEEGTEAQPVLDVYALNVLDGSAPQLIIPFADSPAA